MAEPTGHSSPFRPITMGGLRSALLPTLSRPQSEIPEGRPAAVAAIFRTVLDSAEVLLIRRADRVGDPWSGHMAFPGGRYEPTDHDLRHTAVRETSEEIGLDLELHANLLGVLDDQDATGRKSRAPMPIRPFVFELHREASLAPNEEVTEVIWAPIDPLLRGERASSVEVEYDDVRYTLPAYDVDGRIVWGLTYRMLQALFNLFRTPAE